MKQFRTLFALVVIAAVMTLGAAKADTLAYSNGSHSASDGNNPFTSRFVAQNFSLSQASVLDKLVFNVFTAGDTIAPTAIHVNIYQDNGGSVGSLLMGGSFTKGAGVVTDTGVFGFYTLKDYTVNLPLWSLGSGNYYIALQADPSQWNFHWTITNDSSHSGNDYIGDGTNFSNYNFDHEFELYTDSGETNPVPEP